VLCPDLLMGELTAHPRSFRWLQGVKPEKRKKGREKNEGRKEGRKGGQEEGRERGEGWIPQIVETALRPCKLR